VGTIVLGSNNYQQATSNQYPATNNELLIKEYDGKEPVFDLAKTESTLPDGTRETFTKDGKTHYSMVLEYTHDGGHLNETGHKKAAEQLLILLASL
jgi:lysophospholipase L1-like esterase